MNSSHAKPTAKGQKRSLSITIQSFVAAAEVVHVPPGCALAGGEGVQLHLQELLKHLLGELPIRNHHVPDHPLEVLVSYVPQPELPLYDAVHRFSRLPLRHSHLLQAPGELSRPEID